MVALERSQCHQESHGLQGNTDEGARDLGKVSLGVSWPWRTGRGRGVIWGRIWECQQCWHLPWKACLPTTVFSARGKVCTPPTPNFRPSQACAAPLPKGFSSSGLAVDTGEDGQSVLLYRPLPRPGPLLLKGVLALSNNCLPYKELTIMPRAGAWGRTHRQVSESQRRIHRSPTATSSVVTPGR